MELMIKHSEILTITIQISMIIIAGFIFVGCWDELMNDIKSYKKRYKKGGKKSMRVYKCPICGFKAWALDHITETSCRICGHIVKTEPMEKCRPEESFMFNRWDKVERRGLFSK